MKSAISPQLVLSMCLLSLAGVRAASAAEPAIDGQEQARLLLGGKNLTLSDANSGTGALSATTRPPAAEFTARALKRAADAQEQARLLLAGKNSPVSRPKSRGAVRSAAAALPAVGSTSPAPDPQEQARRMILGS